MADDPIDAGGLDDLERRMAGLSGAAEGFGRALTGALKAAAVDGRSLDAVLRTLVLRLSDRALASALAPLGDLAGGLAARAAGGLLAALAPGGSGRILPFADGGVVASPTYFPIGTGTTGLAGEAGPEAILPLARGPDGRMGVSGGAGSVHVTVNVTTPDAESFRRSEAQITGMLARAAGRGRRGL